MGSIHYCALYQFDDDVRETRIKLLRKSESNIPLNPLEDKIVKYNNAVPFTSGRYPYYIIYRLPGKNTVLERVKANFIYNK